MTSVLHISTDYKPVGERIGHGGVERLVHWLSSDQRRRGDRVAVVTMPGSDAPGARPLFPSDTQAVKASDPDAYAALRARAHAAIDTMLATERWDVVHDHMGAYLTSEPGPSIPRGTGVVLSAYGLRSNPHYADIYRRAGALQAKRPLVVTACSASHRAHLRPVLSADLVVHHAVPERPLLDGAPDHVLSVDWCAVMPGKGQLEVALATRRAHAKVVFAGPLVEDSPAAASYAARFLEVVERADLATTLAGLDERSGDQPPVYVGEVRDTRLQEALFARAGRFVLCARHDEPFSLALLEAMAYGVPPAAGPFGSAREALGRVGHFVRSLRARDIAAALVWRGPSRARVQAHARRAFGVSAWASRWDEVYAEAIGRAAVATSRSGR